MIRSLMIALLSFSISACQAETVDSLSADDACGASGYQSMIGNSIAAITLPSSLDHRVIGPDTMVTEDFVPTRLNFYTDSNSVILKITCG